MAVTGFNNLEAGSISIYRNTVDGWVKDTTITGGYNERNGMSLSFSHNGKVLAVGSPDDDSSYPNGEQDDKQIGSVKVYVYNQGINGENIWTEFDIMGTDCTRSCNFGFSVSLNADGSVLSVGERYANIINGNLHGRVHFYKYNPGQQGFEKTHTLDVSDDESTPFDEGYNNHGHSISLNADGTIAAVGAPNYFTFVPFGTQDSESFDLESAGQGRVYILKYDPVTDSWQTEETIFERSDNKSFFGFSVSLSADGDIVAVGRPQRSTNSNVDYPMSSHGSVVVFKKSSTEDEWVIVGEEIHGTSYGNFGYSVSLSSDGTLLAVGEPYTENDNKGAVHIYMWDGYDWEYLRKIESNTNNAYNSFGYSTSISGDGTILTVGALNSFGDMRQGFDSVTVHSPGFVELHSLLSSTATTVLNLPGTSGENGWHLFTSPWSNPLNDFLEPLWTQGMIGSDAPDYGASNVYTYSESTQQYTALPSLETSVIPGIGYALYAYTDDDNDGASVTWPKTLTGSGNNSTRAVSIAVSNTDLEGSTAGLSGEEGWNLMGNPYPYSIVVDSVISALQEVDAGASTSVYIWNKAANDGEGAYLNSQENGIQNIAPFQAFWVRLLSPEASGNAVIRPTARTASFATFYKTISGSIPAPMLSFTMSHEGFSSKARLRFNEQAQVGIDPYDVFSKAPLSERYVRMYSEVGDQQLSSNYLPLSGQQMQIPFVLSSSELGTYELEWRVQEIPSDWTLNLIDSQGVSHALSTDGGIVFEVTETGEFPVFEVEWIPGTSNEVNPELPQRLELSQNYPNPFNPTTIIQFSLPQAGQAKVMVYNVMGQKVLELGGKRYEAGVHRLRMDARSLASGVYIYQLFVDGAWVQTQKMTLIK